MRNKILLTTAVLAMLGTAALELKSHAAMAVSAPKRSQSTGEAGNAILTDEGSRRLPLVGVVFPNSSGATGLNSHVVAGKVSSVTGKEEPARYRLASGVEIPLMALASIDTSTHLTKPLVLPAANVTLAGDVTGPASASVVALVGGSTASAVHAAELVVAARDAAPSASTLAVRDSLGNAKFNQLGLNATALGDFPSGGSVGSAVSTVDISFVLNVSQTTASQTLTLPSPTDASHAHLMYVYNAGSAAFTVLGSSLAAGAARGALWNGSAWVGL